MMTTLPAAPSRSDAPATFITKADAFVAALPTFVTEANTLQTDVTTKQTTASAAATSAATSASQAAVTGFAMLYTFDSTTSMAAPATGKLRLNNATISSVTAMALDAASADSGNPSVIAYLATWGASTNNTVKGHITLRKVGTPSTFATFSISSAVTNNTTWAQITVAYVTGNGTLINADSLALQYVRAGDAGTNGAGAPANLTLTNPASPATLTIAGGSTLVTSGAFSTTLVSTATTVATLPAGTVTLAQLGSNTFAGTQNFSGATVTGLPTPASAGNSLYLASNFGGF